MLRTGDKVRYTHIPGIDDKPGVAVVVNPHVRYSSGCSIATAQVNDGGVLATWEFWAYELTIMAEAGPHPDDRSDVGTFPFLNPGAGRV